MPWLIPPFLPSPGMVSHRTPGPCLENGVRNQDLGARCSGRYAGPPALLLHPHGGPSHPSSDTPGPPTRRHGPISVKIRAVSLQPRRKQPRSPPRTGLFPAAAPLTASFTDPKAAEAQPLGCLPSFRKVARPQSACRPGSLLTSQVTLFSKAQCLCRRVLYLTSTVSGSRQKSSCPKTPRLHYSHPTGTTDLSAGLQSDAFSGMVHKRNRVVFLSLSSMRFMIHPRLPWLAAHSVFIAESVPLSGGPQSACPFSY